MLAFLFGTEVVMWRNLMIGFFCLVSMGTQAGVRPGGEHPFPVSDCSLQSAIHVGLSGVIDGKTLVVFVPGLPEMTWEVALEGVDAPVLNCNGNGQGPVAQISREVLRSRVENAEDLVLAF